MRALKTTLALSFVLGITLGTATAHAAGKKDKEVDKLVSQAIDEDYLATEYDKALGKLKKAVDLCAKSAEACSPEAQAKVHIANATVLGVGMSKLEEAKKSLVLALQADPSVKLLDGLTTPELEKAFKQAQAEASSGGGEASGGDTTEDGGEDGGKPKGKGKGKKPKGGEEDGGSEDGGGGDAPAADFQHEPVPAQALNTPVPIFAEIPDDVGATKVIARFKPFGGGKWETLTLQKMEGGWGAEVPCTAVTTTGDLKYFIVASDETGTPVATAGSMKQPFKVPIKNKLAKGTEKPSLPGQDPPKACKAAEDCPPGLPGCGGSGEGKAEGAICDATPECNAGLACVSGVCTPTGEEIPDPNASKGTHHAVSVGAQFDLSLVSDGANVCSASSAASYICMVQDSSDQFVGNPADVRGTNGISGGLAFGGARILGGYDYFFKFGLGLGARVGVAFGGPSISADQKIPGGSQYNQLGKSFFPVHAEGRATWKFLHPNPEAGELAPYAFVGGGGAQVNAAVPVTVCDKLKEGGSGDCPGQTKVDAYQLSGLTFATFGGGATYMFIRNFGLSAELKFMVLFPTTGFTISPTVAPVFAF